MTNHDDTQELISSQDNGTVEPPTVDEMTKTLPTPPAPEVELEPELGRGTDTENVSDDEPNLDWRTLEAADSQQSPAPGETLMTTEAYGDTNDLKASTPPTHPTQSSTSFETGGFAAPMYTTSHTFGIPPQEAESNAQAVQQEHRSPSEPESKVRVGQLVWSGIVIIIGIFLYLITWFDRIDIPTALISLIAIFGVFLIGTALVPAGTKEKKE